MAGYNKLQKHEREVLKALRKTWPQAQIAFDKSRSNTHGLIEVVMPEGDRVTTSIGSSPSNPSAQVPIVLRNIRNRLAACKKREHP